ncbi:MAG TPA: two-component regulator propeller domain-containing protein [Candidatus Didemnitutus sp.]|nr:two-component regulator propeller domain-containing protein [Candidatus Didemnitutus sp.]
MRDLFSTWVLLPLFLLLLVLEVSGQDMRGVLDLDSRRLSFSTSASGRVWMMTDKGLLYSARSLRDAWTREAQAIFPDVNEWGPFNLGFGDIVYVSNNDSLLIVTERDNFLMRERYSMRLLRTTDRGRTWSIVSLPNDSVVSTIVGDDRGRLWAGTAHGAIVYSSDEGWTWSVVHAPSTESGDVTSITMADSLLGIAATSRGEVYLTTDNWRTLRTFTAPTSTHPAHNKVFLLGRTMVVRTLFNNVYCDIDDTVWHELTPSTDRLTYDRTTKRLLDVTPNGSVVSFRSPTVVDTLDSDADLRSNDQFVFSNTSIAIRRNSTLRFVERSPLPRTVAFLSNDVKVATPEIRKKLTNGFVGVDQYFLYYSLTGSDSTWERKVMLPQQAAQLIALNDSTVIVDLWKYYLQVNVHTWQLKPYTPMKPISAFCASDITTVTFMFKSHACFGGSKRSSITFSRIPSGDLACSSWTNGTEVREYRDTITSIVLREGLDRFNEDPYRVTTIKDLGLTANDVASAPSILALDPDTPFLSYHDKPDLKIETTSYALVSIVIVNANSDTLTIQHRFDNDQVFLYPLPLFYGGFHFQLADPSIVTSIGSALPPDFPGEFLFKRSAVIDLLTRRMMK